MLHKRGNLLDIKIEVYLDQLHSTPNLTGLKILIADDCEENQFLFSHLLKRKGALISTSFDGLEAVEKALTEKFDIILMDIQMPFLNGYQALEKLKSSGLQIPPIVAVTASAQRDEKNKLLEAGFAGYVAKPLDKDLLINTILNLTQKTPEVLNA